MPNWDLSIECSLSRNNNSSNKQEITAIKAHLHKMGFKLKPVKANREDAHCYVEMISHFKIEHFKQAKGLKFTSQKGTVYYNPKSPLRDLLHELDHIYQLQEEARINKRSYLKATVLKIKLVDEDKTTNVPPVITKFLLQEVMQKDSFKIEGEVKVTAAKSPWYLPRKYNPRHVIVSLGKSELPIIHEENSPHPENNLTIKDCETILKFANQWNELEEAEQRELLESIISDYDNEAMEIAAYQRESERAIKIPGLHLAETELKKLEERSKRFLGDSKKSKIFKNDTWDHTASKRLMSIPHLYLKSRGYVIEKAAEKDYDTGASMSFFSPKEKLFMPSGSLEASIVPEFII